MSDYELNEKIYESYSTLVFKGKNKSNSADVIIKTQNSEYPEVLEISSYKREYEIGKAIQSKAVLQYYDLYKDKNNYYLVMEDFGGNSLDSLILPEGMDLGNFLEIACSITNALAVIHKKGVIHKDIKPQNILINPKSKTVKIIDFGISSLLSQEKISFQSINALEGTLEYISPEQTGRVNRPIDYRSDFYSLGITFYEMITGKLPYRSTDTMEIVHNHIARIPDPPHKLRLDIPDILSSIIMKLISKSVDERYRSAKGLLEDLTKIKEKFFNNKKIESFPLEQLELHDKFVIPQKLYGREKEIETLLNSFERVCSAQSDKEIIFISGAPGIGKSAFVNEIHKPITEKKGFFLFGKFEQYKKNIPFFSLLQAFKSVIKMILSEPELEIEKWRSKILNAVGLNGQILIDVIPELEILIGKQNPVEDLTPTESQNRFNDVFMKFFSIFLRKEHPLVLFLDDLQWADLATLHFLEAMLTNKEMQYLLLIGCYRDTEVDPAHPLVKTIEVIKKDFQVSEIILNPISLYDISNLMNDLLHEPKEKTNFLSNLIHSKTLGNPFFINQFLYMLNEEKIVQYNYNQFCWQWDEKEIQQKDLSNDVFDLISGKMQKVSKGCEEILRIASCIGNTFQLDTLSVISGKSKYHLASYLFESIKEGLIIPLDDSYKYILDEETSNYDINYKFTHDRIQQYVYSILSDKEKELYHYNIGTLLKKNSNVDEIQESLFEIVSHWNIGRNLISEDTEKIELVRLNLQAGDKARRSNAYKEAIEFYHISVELLGEKGWIDNYDLAFSVYINLASCNYLSSNFQESEKIFQHIENNLKSKTDKLNLYYNKLILFHSMAQVEKSVDIGIEGLKFYGLSIPKYPSLLSILLEFAKVNLRMRGRKISDLINLKENTDPSRIWLDSFMMALIQPAYISGNENLHVLFELIVSNNSIKAGYTDYSSLAFVSLGVLLCAAFNQSEKGYEYGQFALNLIEKTGRRDFKPRVLFLFSCLILPWNKHLKETIVYGRESYEISIEMGDYVYAAYSGNRVVAQKLNKGDNLDSVIQESIKYTAFMKKTGIQNLIDNVFLWKQIAIALKGGTENPLSWNSNDFDEQLVFNRMKESGYTSGLCFYYLYKSQKYFLYGNFQTALEMIEEADKLKKSLLGLSDYAEIPYYYALILSSFISNNGEGRKLSLVKKKCKQISEWAKHCPENFSHKELLIKAEIANLEGKDMEAMHLYEKAIHSAIENEYNQNAAIAFELASKYYAKKNLSDISKSYLINSYYYYKQWGAELKAQDVERKNPNLFKMKGQANLEKATMKTYRSTSIGRNLDFLDIETIIKSSQAISAEIELDILLKTIIKISTENSGAEKGILLLNEKNGFELNLEWEINKGYKKYKQNLGDSEIISKMIVEEVAQITKAVIIKDAGKESKYKEDGYIKKYIPKSILCLPLITKNKVVGIFYFENNLISHAFTEERVEIIQLIASQAAISIENARLFDSMQRLNEANQKFVPTPLLSILEKESITDLKLGDQTQKEMAILFSDIRDFTSLSEKLSPQENFNFINSYLSRMGPHVRKNHGFIDKYIGDAVMALFPRRPEDAIQSGIDMQREVILYNEHRAKQGIQPISIGIGIHTGSLMLGIIGELERMEGTVISDAVNLASRLEGLTKMYGISLMISEDTLMKVEHIEQYKYRLLDNVVVKGKQTSIRVYQVFEGLGTEEEDLIQMTKLSFELGIESYINKRFEEALQLFENVAKQNPKDYPTQLYIKRCKTAITEGVSEDWTGIMKFTEK